MYIWNFDDGEEVWYEEPLPTVEDCLNAARECVKDFGSLFYGWANKVYIGEAILFQPNSFSPGVDIDEIITTMSERNYKDYGKINITWEKDINYKQKELDELSNEISKVIMIWLKKYGHEPKFYKVENVKEYKL